MRGTRMRHPQSMSRLLGETTLMKRHIRNLCCALLLVGASAHAQTPPSALWFQGARLITGDGSAPIEDAAFLVEDGRFTWVGRRNDRRPPAGAARIEITGKTVIPALIDGHSHPGYLNFRDGSIRRENYSREQLIDHMRRYAYYGVAAVYSMGLDRWDVDPELPYELREEALPNAARFLMAGRGIAATPMAGPPFEYWLGIPYGAETPAEGRQRVDALEARNVSLVKIWVDDRYGSVPILKPDVYRAIIDEAGKNGQTVTAHIGRNTALADAKDLLRAGIHGFAHSVRDRDIDDEYIELLRQHPDVWLMPNLPYPPVSSDELPLLAETLPPAEIDRLRREIAEREAAGAPASNEFFELQCRNLRRTHAETRNKIVLATDGRGGAYDVHIQLANMVRCGLSPAEAIVAATKSTAEILGLDDLGTVADGKSADFVVLDADPLTDIRNTRRIAATYLRGIRVDREALRASWTAGGSGPQ